MDLENKKTVQFKYCNYKGDLRIRKVIPAEIWFGTTEYHPGEQWFLKAFDVEKEDYRDFSMKDIVSWEGCKISF